MKLLYDFIREGGPVMLAILTLSVVLYSRCCKLVLSLRRSRRRLNESGVWHRSQLPLLRQMRDEIQESFRQQRVALAALVASAPLLGLLGTVSGMVTTFESLSARATGKSMEDLARGISQVLVATESGLAVAIPALVIIYYVHGGVRRYVQRLNQIEAGVQQEQTP
jgi:biopolymer transport protein ExbB